MRLAFQIIASILFILFLFAPLLFLSACGGASTGTTQQVGMPRTTKSVEANLGRFSVTYQGFFTAGKEDYKMNRAIYTIIDTSTGQEYIGIEGVGVSACRQSGKSSVAE